jgi:hypothetical protein
MKRKPVTAAAHRPMYQSNMYKNTAVVRLEHEGTQAQLEVAEQHVLWSDAIHARKERVEPIGTT